MRMRHLSDDERRARIADRHAVALGRRSSDPVAATRAMTVLHATEPATVYLSLFARVDGLEVTDVERALYDERSLVKQLAMRRTLFVFPRDLLPAAWGSASARVAGQVRRRIAQEIAAAGITEPDVWLETAREQIHEALRDTDGLPVTALRETVQMIAGKVAVSPHTKWGGDVPLAPRILGWLGASGELVRGRNSGHWRISRPAWTPMEEWLEEVSAPLEEATGYAALVRRWLGTFGPGTEADLVWWLGSTKTAVRQALADVEAVRVSLDGGGTGWVLPGDEESAPAEVEPWAALLPVLDPTTMGWRDRDFYLDPRHTPYLFDSNGNGGTTAWWDGRIVGCWVQDDAGVVHVVSREELGRDATAALAVEAERLTAWLGGVRIGSVYTSPQMKSAVLP